MAEYISAPIAVDPDDYKALAFDYLRAQVPEWEPADGNLDAWIIEAFAEIAAPIGESAVDVMRSIFREYGRSLVNIPPREASSATGTASWTLIDSAGYTIPAGTVIPVRTTAKRGVATSGTRAGDASVDAVTSPLSGSSCL